MKKFTYKDSGVDIGKAGVFKHKIAALVKSSFRPGVLKGIGGFGSLFAFDAKQYKHPVLVSSTDGVGTKLKIAILSGKHDTVGIDLVGMNVNDILCVGAEPLFFLDYIATAKLEPAVLTQVVKGINDGCIQAGCSLVGGETAEMPGMYKKGEYDLAGFCVGAVEKDKIIDGSQIEAQDTILGLESSGIHSNGYSLVRKVFTVREQLRMSKELLMPTRIYVKPVLSLLRDNELTRKRDNVIKGIAHITGGAFYDKIARILPDNINAVINKNAWSVPKIFRLIQNKGGINDFEMYHTFNMGIGMVLFVPRAHAKAIAETLSGSGVKTWIIGEAVKGNKEVEVV